MRWWSSRFAELPAERRRPLEKLWRRVKLLGILGCALTTVPSIVAVATNPEPGVPRQANVIILEIWASFFVPGVVLLCAFVVTISILKRRTFEEQEKAKASAT